MYRLQDIPYKIEQKGVQIDPKIVESQLELNGRLGRSIMRDFLKTAKQCVITVGRTDFGLEASVASEDGKTQMPGFYVAPKREDVTVPKELARAARYITDKYVSRLEFVSAQPFTYQISRIPAVDLGNPGPTGFRHGIVHVEMKPVGIDAKTEREYWASHIAPKLSGAYERGKAVKALAEAERHQANTLTLPFIPVPERAIRQNMAKSLYCLLEMMSHHALTPEHGRHAYKADDGEYLFSDNLEFSIFYDPELCKQVFSGRKQIFVPMERVIKVK
jgi:hypothetical protein